jgi:hypothetical protein
MVYVDFDAAGIPTFGGSRRGIEVKHMITIDALGTVFYVQAAMSIILFFCVQILILMELLSAHKFESVADWLIYRGSWIGLGFQVISLTITALLVFNFPTDHTKVTYTLSLILLNTVWFVSVRLLFLIVDYKYSRQSE